MHASTRSVAKTHHGSSSRSGIGGRSELDAKLETNEKMTPKP